MKIQLDTDNKTIKLESDVKISKLLETLKKLLPNGEYREFTLETNTTIQTWTHPIVIHDHWHTPHWQPWYVSKFTADYSVRGGNEMMLSKKDDDAYQLKSGDAYQLKSGVFNVEV